MAVPKAFRSDADAILRHRRDNGADYWSTLEGAIGVGSPFSTLESVLMLTELGLSPNSPVLQGAAKRIFASWRDDGRLRVAGSGAIYPCHTTNALRILCRLGYASDARLATTFEHLLSSQKEDGGWRCATYKYGRGPETASSNPGPTLYALDAFRYAAHANRDKRLDRAASFLLRHWETRTPLGPCHFGIGSRFLQVEFPFFRYNLFYYVYVLSFYATARSDRRFLAALKALESHVVDGQIAPEYARRELADLRLCEVGKPNPLATNRFREILVNLNRGDGQRPARPRRIAQPGRPLPTNPSET